MPVAEALDRVLEILRTTELYSPQLGTKDEDPHTNDLVGGLMTVSGKYWGKVILSRWRTHFFIYFEGLKMTATPKQHLFCYCIQIESICFAAMSTLTSLIGLIKQHEFRVRG